jgi:hypothetical protein
MGGGDIEFGVGDTSGLETEITQEIVAEVGPQLSPNAQLLLFETGAPPDLDPFGADFSLFGGAFSGLAAVVKIVKHKVEKLLENRALVDDASLVAEWFLRKYFQDRIVILRTAEGFSFAQPDESPIRSAVEALFAQTDPGANAWLADHQDRWLTIYSDGRATFQDQETEGVFSIDNVDKELALRLIDQMKAGDIFVVRSSFA